MLPKMATDIPATIIVVLVAPSHTIKSGANAAISGDMLTTAGITVETDRKLVKRLGFEVRLDNE